MKQLAYAVAAVVMASAPLAVLSAQPKGTIDVYYVVSPELELEADGVGSVDLEEGDGFGVKGRFNLSPQVFLAGEYQANTYDEVEGFSIDAELDQIRGGAGFRFGADSPFYVLGEFIQIDVEFEDESEDDSGFGVHLGANSPVADSLNFYGQFGYVDVGGDGLEFLAGLAFMFTRQLGGFVDYRHTSLDEDGAEVTLADLRVGLRIALN